MLHTKFHENRPARSGEDFLRVFTIHVNGCGGHLGHVTKMPWTNFRSPYPRRLHIEFGFDWQGGFWEEDVWALWTDDGRTPDHWYTISSPMSLRLRWAKNESKNQRTNGPVNAHLISWPSKAQNIQNLENIWIRNDLDLQYSHTFIISISCLHLPTFRSLAAILSEKSTVFTFSYRKA